MTRGKEVVPKQIYARVVALDDHVAIEAKENPDEFDDEGPIGRYELVEEGTITISNSFVPKALREIRPGCLRPRSERDDRRRRS